MDKFSDSNSKASNFKQIVNARLGKMLVRKGYISQSELDQTLAQQHIMLGQLLIQSKLITPAELDQALTLQPGSNKRLGELLVGQNLVSQGQLENIVEKQYWQKRGFWLIS